MRRRSKFAESDGKFTCLGTTYTLFPLKTLPYRGLLFLGYRLNDIKRVFHLLVNLAFKFMVLIRMRIIKGRLKSFAKQRKIIQNKQVVFVSDRPRAREAKLASALINAGWEVILLYHTKPNFNLEIYFAQSYRYYYSWHGLHKALKFKPVAYHIFTLWDYETAYIFCKNKPGKVIIDTNDTIVGTVSSEYLPHSKWLQQFIPMEKYVFERADGLCCRDLQVQNACRLMKYSRVKNSVFFPEYLWDSKERYSKISKNGSIHIVLVGHFGNDAMGNEKEAGYLDIIKILTSQGIHFHIYPHWFYNNNVYLKKDIRLILPKYFQMEANNPYFHIHATLPMEVVVREISQYDFGIHVIQAVLFKNKYERYTPEAMKICTSARISDYLEACLPIIATTETYMYRYLSRFGVMVELNRENISNLKPILSDKLNGSIEVDFKHVHETLKLSKHAPRLIDFYKRLYR